jgi:putative Ca2+/H+ antiporter (TMEM165/GDT1 family)
MKCPAHQIGPHLLALRDRGVTMLVRVDISADTNGMLSVALSHQAAGFAPYRIDNCTAATLHLRQVLAATACCPTIPAPLLRTDARCYSGM